MSITNKVGVIGAGMVGGSVIDLLQQQYEVLVYDKYKSSDPISEVLKVDYAVIAVPTPMQEDGSCDASAVRETLEVFSDSINHFLIKSAVTPGTTTELADEFEVGLSVSPEYIGSSGSYYVPFWKGYPDSGDMIKHQFQIFGGPRKETNQWIEIFQYVMGPEPEYYQTNARTAELCKYIENTWIAYKVTFVNEIFRIAKIFDVDFRELRELWLADGRVSRMHTSVFAGDRGWGGHCLPKDVSALLRSCEEKGYSSELFEMMVKVNSEIRDANS